MYRVLISPPLQGHSPDGKGWYDTGTNIIKNNNLSKQENVASRTTPNCLANAISLYIIIPVLHLLRLVMKSGIYLAFQ